ncbi:MAG: hypothetical protein FD127_3565, partial [Acidimicrobiaceae bacterium]
MIRLPVADDPVTVTMSVSGWVTMASPTAASPVITWNAPSGRPASRASSARRSEERGVAGAGFNTTVHPA